jgi:ATP adenylyltransferase
MTKPKNDTPLVDLHNAREEDQRKIMEEILAAGHCPFCQENLDKYHMEPTIKDGKYWFITSNQWPYKNTKVHLLAISKRHFENLYEIRPEESAELLSLLGEMQKKYNAPGGAFAMRFGETKYSAGTVRHIHAQFIIPDADKPDFEPVRFKIGSWPKK